MNLFKELLRVQSCDFTKGKFILKVNRKIATLYPQQGIFSYNTSYV